MSKASLDFINSGKCYPSEVLNYVLELEQQITELKESQKQKQIIRLCQRLDKAEQQNKELIEKIKGLFSRSGNDKYDDGYDKAISDVLDIFRKQEERDE